MIFASTDCGQAASAIDISLSPTGFLPVGLFYLKEKPARWESMLPPQVQTT